MDINVKIDIESCMRLNEEVNSDLVSCTLLESASSTKVLNELTDVDWSFWDEKGVYPASNRNIGHMVGVQNVNLLIEIDQKRDVVVDGDLAEKKQEKEKRKSLSAKKPPKPPRPPGELSLDAADQKLIKEIAELALIKRARTERMKALKKMRAAKAAAASSPSGGSYFAMMLTFIFCLVLVCHGISSNSKSPLSIDSSLIFAGRKDHSEILVEDHMSLASSYYNSSRSGSPNFVEAVSGVDDRNLRKEAVGRI